MNSTEYFDAYGYFKDLTEKNKLALQNGFHFCTCSGINSLEGPLNMMRDCQAFVCLDDTNDASMVRGKGGGWFKNRNFTVFLLHRHLIGNEKDRIEKLMLCRNLFRQLVSKMIKDEKPFENDMVLLQTDTILSRELGKYFMPDCTGLYFMIEQAEPVKLCYNPDEWQM